MSLQRIAAFRGRPVLAVLGLVLAGTAALIVVALALDFAGVRGVDAEETELRGVPVDSVGEDFLQPAPPQVPGAPDAPPVPHRTPGPTTIEGPGGLYRVHAGKNDVVQMGEDIVIESGEHVLGHVFAMGGTVTVRGIVDDDVVAMGGDVILEAGAQVRGDAVSLGGQVRKDPGASILGSSVSVGNFPHGVMGLQALNFIGHGMSVVSRLLGLLFMMLVAWVVISLTRARSERIVARIEQAPLAMLGWGALGILGIAPASVAVALAAALLVVTIIGIPVAVLALLGYSFAIAVLMFWGAVIGATVSGAWLVRRLSPRLGLPTLTRHALVGVAAISGLGLVGKLFGSVGVVVPPAGLLGGLLQTIGFLVFSGALCAGVGGILATRAGQPAPLPHIPGPPV